MRTQQKVTWVSIASLILLFGLWTLTAPLFSSPDEPANFIKGAAVVRGDIVGESVAPELLKSYWTTTVDIDPQYGAANGLPWCFAPYPDKPACTYDVATAPQVDGVAWTNMGKYPPLGFAITGLGTVFGPSNLSVYAARIVQCSVCAALLVASGVALRRRGQSLVGMLLALTPGTVFLASTSSPSGLEIVSCIALWSVAPFVLVDSPRRTERVVYACAGVLLIGVRPLGVIFYAVVIATTLFVTRTSLVSGLRRVGGLILGIHATVAALMVWWYVAIYGPATSTTIEFGDAPLGLGAQLDAIIRGLPRLIEQYVGNFGWLDTPSPDAVVWGSMVIVAVGAVVARRSIDGRFWCAFFALLAAACAFAVAADLNYYDILRTFGSQGRHIAPFLVGIPLLIGSRIEVGDSFVLPASVVWGTTTIWSFVVMVRRYSVGVVSGNFSHMWNDPPWRPPLGVTMTFVAFVMVVGGGLWALWRSETRPTE